MVWEGETARVLPIPIFEILENIAAFRKRIDEAVQNKAAQENEEAEQKLSGFELLCFILGEFLKGAAKGCRG